MMDEVDSMDEMDENETRRAGERQSRRVNPFPASLL